MRPTISPGTCPPSMPSTPTASRTPTATSAGRCRGCRSPPGAFRLVVSSHLLFVYPDHFGYPDHLRFAHDLLRMATDEVRLFPLVDTTTMPWPHLQRLRDDLAGDGVLTEVRPVGYEFIRQGNEILVLRPG